jgi:hypothetical protein
MPASGAVTAASLAVPSANVGSLNGTVPAIELPLTVILTPLAPAELVATNSKRPGTLPLDGVPSTTPLIFAAVLNQH